MRGMRLIWIVAVSISIQTAAAQIAKNTILLGGGLGFQFQSNQEGHSNLFTATFSPQLGGFVASNFVLGVQPYLRYLSNSGGFDIYDTITKRSSHIDITQSTLSLGIGPFARYYFKLSPKAYVFLHGSPSVMAAFISNSADPKQPTTRQVNIAWQLGSGLAYWVSSSVAVEGSLYYQGLYRKTNLYANGTLLAEGKSYVDHGVQFHVGLQVYFNTKKRTVTQAPPVNRNIN